MPEEKTYDIVPVIDNAGKYVIENYDFVLASCRQFIAKNKFNYCDATNIKDLKSSRTEIRSRQDAITKARLNINEMLLGQFNEQLKTLESELKDADAHLKALKDEYEKSAKNTLDKPVLIKLTIKSYDAKVIESLKESALKKGCEVEVK